METTLRSRRGGIEFREDPSKQVGEGRKGTASLYLWKGNEAIVCRFHRTPSDWEYDPLSRAETRAFTELLQKEGLAHVSPCEPCEMGYGGERPGGPLSFVEAVLTA